jgi:hypothetical protein
MNTNEMTLIGHFSVDSGQAIVGDPCYLDTWETWDNDSEIPFDEHKNKVGQYGYLGACNATLTQGYGQLGIADAVAFSTGYGDGLYPVYAEINEDGRVARILIDFVGDDE